MYLITANVHISGEHLSIMLVRTVVFLIVLYGEETGEKKDAFEM